MEPSIFHIALCAVAIFEEAFELFRWRFRTFLWLKPWCRLTGRAAGTAQNSRHKNRRLAVSPLRGVSVSGYWCEALRTMPLAPIVSAANSPAFAAGVRGLGFWRAWNGGLGTGTASWRLEIRAGHLWWLIADRPFYAVNLIRAGGLNRLLRAPATNHFWPLQGAALSDGTNL